MTTHKSSRVELHHRGHMIVAAVLKGQPTASIWLGNVRATKEHFVGETVPMAIEAAKAWIDTKHRKSAAQRRRPNVGTVQEYVDAFRARPPKELELRMLRAHAAAGALTATELAAAAGYDSFASANMHYGKLGREIAEAIGLEPDLRKPDASPIRTSSLAAGLDDADEASGHFRWQLHDEVKEALHHLGLLQVKANDR